MKKKKNKKIGIYIFVFVSLGPKLRNTSLYTDPFSPHWNTRPFFTRYYLFTSCSTPTCLPAWCLQEKFDFRLNILKMFNLKSNLSRKQMSIITPTSVLDSDLEIMRGPCHPDPKIRGWGRGGSLQNFFWVLWASVWSKNRGGAGPPGPLP